MPEKRLCDLLPGRSGKVLRIEGRSPFKRRLMEMGIVRGEVITKVKLAPLADPAEYIVKAAHVSLRREEAADVIIEATDNDCKNE